MPRVRDTPPCVPQRSAPVAAPKAPTTQNTVTATAPAAVDICAQNEQDICAQTEQYQTTIDKMCVDWLLDDVKIVGTTKAIVELTKAFLLHDVTVLRKKCDELNIDPKLMFGEHYASRTYTEIAKMAIETKIVNQLPREKLVELIKRGGEEGRQAVTQFFSALFQESERFKEDDERSKQDEHVINKGVISVYRDIVEEFLSCKKITKRGIDDLSQLPREGSQLIQDCENYFDPKIKNDIKNVMKVTIPQKTFYINANAFLYGIAIFALRKIAVAYMMELCPDYDIKSGIPLKMFVEIINRALLYVDQFALVIWLAQNPVIGKITYEQARDAVHCMFDELDQKMPQWVLELEAAGYL